ncbi:MAG: hypothetical protein ACI9U0_001301 [Flavobacteriales bacterium]|jgi:hypothetical protein|tara:strand:+ start:1107 stop:2135 length:1029 start_codon:yes stop_codon:yes gene_type:complete
MKIKNIFQVGLFAGILSACNPVEEVGPLICPTDSFSLTTSDLIIEVVSGETETPLELSNNEVDLSTGGAHISSDFGEVVDWELTISNGSQEKNYSGKSAVMDIFWYGQPNKFENSKLQFDVDKEIEVSLTVVCHEKVTKNLNIVGTQNFSSLNSKYGILLRDWDKNGSFPIDSNHFTVADGWEGENEPGGITVWNLDYLDDFSSPAGGKYIQLHGSGTPNWYLGSHSFPTDGLGDLLSSQNVDSLYVNVMVSSEEGAENTGSQIALQVAGENYSKVEDINWTGWKLLSYKFSDFSKNSGASVPNSNVQSFILQLGASPEQSSNLKVRYDFILVTVGAPLFEQ